MTLRTVEGFDFMPAGLSTSANTQLWAAKRYYPYFEGPLFASNATPPAVETGRFGFGNAMTYNPVPGAGAAYTVYSQVVPFVGSSVSEGHKGIAVYRYSSSSTYEGGPLIGLFDLVNGLPQFTILFSRFGTVKVYRGSPYNGTLIATSDPGVFQENEWFYAEAWGIIDNTSGRVQVRINTKVVVDLVSADTQNTASNKVGGVLVGTYISNPGATVAQGHCSFDDLYFTDTAGSANTGYLGNCRVMTQKVNGNSTPQNFAIGGTSPAPTAWQSVLNQMLDDTSYIYDGTAGDRSLFTIEAIINAPMVFGAQVSGAYRMDDATQRVVGNVIKSGSTVGTGVDHYINQTYTFYGDIFETNPATGVGFTGADLNTLLIGPNVNV